MRLAVVKLPEAKKGFVLLPKRWVVESSNAWAARFRRLARDYEQLAETLAGRHFVAFAILMLKRFVRDSPDACRWPLLWGRYRAPVGTRRSHRDTESGPP